MIAMQDRPRWRTVDEAIREATGLSPLRARAIDPGHVSGTGDGAARALDAISQVLAVMGALPRIQQQILEAYARTRHGYRVIAQAARLSPTHTRRLHLQARDHVAERLEELGLVEVREGA